MEVEFILTMKSTCSFNNDHFYVESVAPIFKRKFKASFLLTRIKWPYCFVRLRTSADYIFRFAFEISEGILRNQKITIGLDSFSYLYFNIYIWPHLDFNSIYIDNPVEICKITVIPFGSMLPNLQGH